jgi:hypothetical protein
VGRYDGAVRVERDDGIEGEEAGTGVGEEFDAGSVEFLGGRGQEDVGLLETREQFGNDAAQVVWFELEGENDRDGVGGPGADLGGVVDGEVGGAVADGERFTEGAGEAFPVELQRGDFGDGERNVRAGSRGAAASSDGRGAVMAQNNEVVAAAAVGAGKVGWEIGAGLEAESFERGKMLTQVLLPRAREGVRAGDRFEWFPGGGRMGETLRL